MIIINLLHTVVLVLSTTYTIEGGRPTLQARDSQFSFHTDLSVIELFESDLGMGSVMCCLSCSSQILLLHKRHCIEKLTINLDRICVSETRRGCKYGGPST